MNNLTCEDTDDIIDCKTDPDFGQFYSSCYTLKIQIGFGKDKYIIREKNCSMADEESCYVVENRTCTNFHNEVTQHGGNMDSCDVQCCSENYCNGRAVDKSSAMALAMALSESNKISYASRMWIITLVTTIYGLCPPLFHAVDWIWK